MNLGIVLSAQHQYNKAEEAYLIALQHRKSYPHCYFNLGNLVSTVEIFVIFMSIYIYIYCTFIL
jgi:hypothetical protein